MRWTRRILCRLIGDRAGAAAIEFALVVPMLLVLVSSTLEAGWIMVQTIMLDRALDQTVRELRVGSFANPTQQAMRQRVCAKAMVLHNCEQAMALELFPITPQGTGYPADTTRCVNRNSPIAPTLRFTNGGRDHIMFVRACYVVSPLTPGLGLGLALPKDASGAMRIIAKSGFMNEPT
ncbi:Flp pilus assembly protein TadG [Devosia lucknowensis]|uniref:Flp pilus assembly protein TadG n=1 Tax=Devosia lucknowensis TaxID=1096929 RepID=A0A1Y6FMG3_9HYPH|nr:TadE/TadG family type IV pilus assembly protein [Devosia lucknowensis]SMQ75907.1 Flp pilus assembly protein TadG [Devosia lucknowensis]